MKLTDVMNERMAVSFEVFPPKDGNSVEPLKETLDRLNGFRPDMISCTHGAMGSNVGRQREILQHIASLGTRPMANYTCIGYLAADVDALVSDYMSIGVNNFLALRGDFPQGWESTRGDFRYGCELAAYLRRRFPTLEIACGAYPEKHLESPDMAFEYRCMLAKQDAGADFVVTQLCHDLDNFLRFRDGARASGFTLPIVFGFMPVLQKTATVSMALSNGCSLPKELSEIIGRYGDDPVAFKQAGKEYSVRQAERILREGLDGIHVFALNRYEDAAEIVIASGISRLK